MNLHFPHHQPPDISQQPMPLFPKVTAASSRRRRRIDPAALVSAAVVLLMAVIAVYVVLQDDPARSAADNAAVVAKPTATPGPRVPQDDTRSAATKPVEMSPPLAVTVPGDGTWLIGKEIKQGMYQSVGGASCYWARLANLSGELEAVIANSFGRNGPQKVALGPDDAAFATQGCGPWELVQP